MGIMKHTRKKDGSKSADTVLHGVQAQGKISHWKKIRIKRKQAKQEALKMALQSEGSSPQQTKLAGLKVKTHKKFSGKKQRHLKKGFKRKTSVQNDGEDGNTDRTDSQKQTVKNGTMEHVSTKHKKNKWRKLKKRKEAVSSDEKPTSTVHSEEGSKRVRVLEGETSNAVKLPVMEISSNWRKLQTTVQPKKKRKKSDTTADEEKKPETTGEEIWFDDVDEILLEKAPQAKQNGREAVDPLVMPDATTGLTKVLAMDCEMVGVGKDGEESVLARVSIVNQHGHCVYDKFVRAREKVTDFRTHVSGVRPYNLERGEDFEVVQKEVADMLKGRVLVGHALHNDLKVLFLDHPRKKIRDTARYKPFQQLMGTNRPALKKLVAKVLGVSVQHGEHSSIQDAQAAMRLYTMHRKRWEHDLKSRRLKKTSQ